MAIDSTGSQARAEAAQRLAAAGLDGAPPEGFVEALFGRVPPEDLGRLGPEALAALARRAWADFAERAPGRAKVLVANPDAPESLESVTVVVAVNDDMPFLLDSALADISERGLEMRLVAHPILALDRDAAGRLTAFRGDANRAADEDTPRDSLILILIDRVSEETRADLAASLERVFADVRLATGDWHLMQERIRRLVEAYRTSPPAPIAPEDVAETIAFLTWLSEDSFTLLGVRDYALTGAGEDERLTPIPETGLGLLRDPDLRLLRRGSELVAMTPEILEFLHEPVPLIVTKASLRSRVHRPAYLDYIGVKLFGEGGRLAGEVRIIGLFTAGAYTQSPRAIPYLRQKVERVAASVGFDPDSHSGKALLYVLESYPRDELFQLDPARLRDFALEVLTLYERPRVRVLPRVDRFDRFVSVVVYVPRERYDSAVRQRIGAFLAEAYHGHVSAYYPSFPEGPLARVHFIIGRRDGATPAVDRDWLEAEIRRLSQTWPDALRAALAEAHPIREAQRLARRYAGAFSAGYQEAFAPRTALADIDTIEQLTPEHRLAIDFHHPDDAPADCAGLKVLSLGRPLPLSERVPMLEAMGFLVIDERTWEIQPQGAPAPEPVFLHDMLLTRARGGAVPDDLGPRLEALIVEVLTGRMESDGYNALVLEAGLGWRDVQLVRALSRYLRQARVPFSQDYMWSTLVRHSAIAAKIVALFDARFDPDRFETPEARGAAVTAVLAEIEADLAGVASLDEDRILRRFVNLVLAALRSNLFQAGADGGQRRTVALKLDSGKVEDLPFPRPLFEIFVYDARVEGVHLRFGKVARGGIRWSDRPQDFRTEVLGLVKAQQVKNAVIVPVGAKGGFTPKKLPAGPREAVQAEGIEAYRLFISTLLDLTDNLSGDRVVPPPRTVRHDGDDPYLVVAADKGTATFSDTANAISAEHGFWLDDAFASGGSAGYDHKAMGITARGAWEAVKRHFRELDTDIQTTPFTVAGVGDMSGDVFGNAMLLSPAIKLVAAFDHRDIFLDPAPDPAVSLAERQRLFALPRSSWQDYDKALISPGGGVFPRSAKSVALSPEIRAVLGVAAERLTPAELIAAILRAPVDLLFFGGIGTYVRASTETDEEVGDRANDPVRIKASELRTRVIGEGANLGMTQRGRIEAAKRGVRLNTDAIDNSAGVNTSDVEVNIKIALAPAMREGRLDRPSRNALLAEMTREVASLVLRNNYQQTLAITLAERRGAEDVGFAQRLMQNLEARGLLDRALEFLPDDASLSERARTGEGLTRPEIAVLLAYAKMSLKADLLASGVPDDPYLSRELIRYFPSAMQDRFPEGIRGHRLRRDIIATMLANSMINRGGPTLVVRLSDQATGDVAAFAAAFAAVRESYRMVELNAAIDALDAQVPGALQTELYGAVQDLLLSRAVWFLRNVDLGAGLDAIVGRFRPGVEEVSAALGAEEGTDAARRRSARAAELARAGVPDDLALRMGSLPLLATAPDAVLIAEATGRPISAAARLLFAVGDLFQLDRITAAARALPVADHFERLAVDRAIDQLAASARAIAIDAAELGAAGAAVERWAAARPESERFRRTAQEIAGSGLTLAKLAVVTSLLGDLARRR